MNARSIKRVLLISYHFYPDSAVGARRPTEFAKSLSEQGFEIDVLTVRSGAPRDVDFASSTYEVKEFQDPINWLWKVVKNLKLKFVSDNDKKNSSVIKTESLMTDKEKRAVEYKNESLLRRLKRYVLSYQALLSAQKLWIVCCIFRLLFLKLKGKKYDIVLSSSPPFSVSVVSLVAKKLFSAKWVCDFRDPLIQWEDVYPECISGYRVFVEEYLNNKFFEASSHLIVTTPSFYAELKDALSENNGDKLSLIYNGYDGMLRESSRSQGDEKFRIVHAGTLYMNRDPMPFLKAVKKIKDSKDELSGKLVVDFYGDCFEWGGNNLVNWIKDNGVEGSVILHGRVPVSELTEIYNGADMLLAFAQKQPKQIPAKIFEYIPYSGVILTVAESDSDTAKLINQGGLGRVSSDSIDEIYCSILDVYRDREAVKGDTVSLSKSEYSRMSQNYKLIKILETACYA